MFQYKETFHPKDANKPSQSCSIYKNTQQDPQNLEFEIKFAKNKVLNPNTNDGDGGLEPTSWPTYSLKVVPKDSKGSDLKHIEAIVSNSMHSYNLNVSGNSTLYIFVDVVKPDIAKSLYIKVLNIGNINDNTADRKVDGEDVAIVADEIDNNNNDEAVGVVSGRTKRTTTTLGSTMLYPPIGQSRNQQAQLRQYPNLPPPPTSHNIPIQAFGQQEQTLYPQSFGSSHYLQPQAQAQAQIIRTCPTHQANHQPCPLQQQQPCPLLQPQTCPSHKQRQVACPMEERRPCPLESPCSHPTNTQTNDFNGMAPVTFNSNATSTHIGQPQRQAQPSSLYSSSLSTAADVNGVVSGIAGGGSSLLGRENRMQTARKNRRLSVSPLNRNLRTMADPATTFNVPILMAMSAGIGLGSIYAITYADKAFGLTSKV
jgi:hypothetical protein